MVQKFGVGYVTPSWPQNSLRMDGHRQQQVTRNDEPIRIGPALKDHAPAAVELRPHRPSLLKAKLLG